MLRDPASPGENSEKLAGYTRQYNDLLITRITKVEEIMLQTNAKMKCRPDCQTSNKMTGSSLRQQKQSFQLRVTIHQIPRLFQVFPRGFNIA